MSSGREGSPSNQGATGGSSTEGAGIAGGATAGGDTASDSFTTEIEEQYKKSLSSDPLDEIIPEVENSQGDQHIRGVFKAVAAHADLEPRRKRLVNYHEDDETVGALEKTTDYVLRKLDGEVPYPGHLCSVGSCADECRVGRTSEMDTLYEMIGAYKFVSEGKNSFSVYSKTGEKIVPSKLREKFADAVERAVKSCPHIGEGKILSHGGYNAPQFSGVRYSGPAITILLRTADKKPAAPQKSGMELGKKEETEQRYLDISIDITPAFKLPVDHDVVQDVRRKMQPLQKTLPRKSISKTDVHLVPDVKNDAWMLTTALLEAKLFSSLPDNSSLKMAFALGKIVNYHSSHTDSDTKTDLQQRIIEEMNKMKQLPPHDVKLLKWNRCIRYAHSFLGQKDAARFGECAKHDVSTNSAGLKHVLLRKVLNEPSFFKDAKDLENDFKTLVLEMFQTIATLQTSEIQHAFLEGCKLNAFSLSKTALLGEQKTQLKQHVRNQYKLSYLFDENNKEESIISTRSELLLDAAEWGQQLMVKMLIAAGAKVDFPDALKGTPLIKASTGGHTDIVSQLLKAGADVNAVDADGHTVLIGASIEGHTDTVAQLLKAGVDINAEDKYGYTALSCACLQGHLDAARHLVSRGAEIEKGGRPPLGRAAFRRHMEVVKWLLGIGADVNAVTRDSGDTAMSLACQEGHTEVAHELVKHGADLELGVPLGMAAWGGHMELVDWLLQKGVTLNSEDKFGGTPMYYASISGNLEVAKKLVSHGALVDVGSLKPLGGAACYTHIDIVNWLLDTAGADVGLSDKDGDTALHCVCRTGHFDVVDGRSSKDGLLVGLGGNKQLEEKDKAAHLGIAKLLLEKGVDVNATNKAGLTALYYACAHGYHEVAEELVKHGAEFDLGVSKPLTGAALGGHVKTTAWLLKLGADANDVDSDDHTALWHVTNKKQKLEGDKLQKLDKICDLLNKQPS